MAALPELYFQEFYRLELRARVSRVTFRPQDESAPAAACPRQRLPSGNIVVSAATDRVWAQLLQRRREPRVQQQMRTAGAKPPRRQDFVGESHFIFVNA